jgi:hypothetical protein
MITLVTAVPVATSVPLPPPVCDGRDPVSIIVVEPCLSASKCRRMRLVDPLLREVIPQRYCGGTPTTGRTYASAG